MMANTTTIDAIATAQRAWHAAGRPPKLLLDSIASLSHETLCRAERFGHAGDGGWWLCTDLLSQPCVIFSFGVGYDPSFDTEAASRLPSCKVISLDPTPAVRSALTATDAEWSRVNTAKACSADAPRQIAEASSAASRLPLARSHKSPAPRHA